MRYEGITCIPIINDIGNEVEFINVHDRLTYIGGRVSKGKKFYYKGLGTVYRNHSVIDPRGFEQPRPSDIFYYGYTVSNPAWVGRYGIFLCRMQPYFSDLIGSCGPKELKILKNSIQFKMSSVVVDNIVKWTNKYKGQYYFVLQYECGRRKYLQNPQPQLLLKLLEYMSNGGWCVPWDKGFINDVTYNGKVSDVADMFRSVDFIHKIGTIYAAFYSLWKEDVSEFSKLCKVLGWNNPPHKDGLWAGVYIVSMANRFLKGQEVKQPKRRDMYEIADLLIRDTLLRGRNCASVEEEGRGDKVAREYIKRYKKSIGANKIKENS